VRSRRRAVTGRRRQARAAAATNGNVGRELKALRQEIKKTKKDADKAEKVDKVEKSEPVQGAVQTTVESSHALTSYETGIAPTKPMPSVAGVKVTLGGFIAAESVYRTHN
jgi:hypothetical protein